jgi:hypothetical protein
VLGVAIFVVPIRTDFGAVIDYNLEVFASGSGAVADIVKELDRGRSGVEVFNELAGGFCGGRRSRPRNTPDPENFDISRNGWLGPRTFLPAHHCRWGPVSLDF